MPSAELSRFWAEESLTLGPGPRGLLLSPFLPLAYLMKYTVLKICLSKENVRTCPARPPPHTFWGSVLCSPGWLFWTSFIYLPRTAHLANPSWLHPCLEFTVAPEIYFPILNLLIFPPGWFLDLAFLAFVCLVISKAPLEVRFTCGLQVGLVVAV